MPIKPQTNVFRVSGSTAIIDISTKKFPKTFTVIDRHDLIRVIDGNGRWRAQSLGSGGGTYAGRWKSPRRGGPGLELMHRLIMAAPDGQMVDHHDLDELNNRSGNLRFCTRSQNKQNSRPCKNHSSRFKGVSFHKRERKWAARIRNAGRLFHLGYFRRERAAAAAYDEAAAKLFGEFACPNF